MCPASSPTRAITRRRRRRSIASCPIPSSTSTPASRSADEVRAAGIDIGTPIVYQPQRRSSLPADRIAGTSVDDRAGCAVIVEVARALQGDAQPADRASRLLGAGGVQPARRAVTAAQALRPTSPSSSTSCSPPTRRTWRRRGDVVLGGGPAMSLYSFHGRGTLNGTIPHPALVALFDATARRGGAAAAAERPYRRADRLVLCAARRRRRRVRSISASRCATRIPRWRSAISAISSA